MKNSKLFLIPIIAGMVSVKAQVINTIAGNGIGGYSGDYSEALNAELYNPNGIITDKKGNLYIADEGNNVVRKVTPDGIITTIAGNGTDGYTGDGCLAVNAKLSTPIDVAVDSVGNVYIVEMGNQLIRKVTTDGKIYTVAGNKIAGYSGDGGKATMASLYYPQGIAIYKNKIYISEQSSRIRLVCNNIITTVAGIGTDGYNGDGGLAINAQLNQPYGMTCDSTGNLYIADSENNRIRCINAQTGIISTAVGNSSSYYTNTGNAFVSANLNFPTDVAINHNVLYVADAQNYRIKKICLDTISTLAGDGISGYSGDGETADMAEIGAINSLAIDTAGNILLSDYNNYVIRKINTPSNQTSSIKNLAFNNNFIVYPNPAKDVLYVSNTTENSSDKSINFVLFDINGNRMADLSANSKTNTFDLSNYENGEYMLQINSNESKNVYKIIKESK